MSQNTVLVNPDPAPLAMVERHRSAAYYAADRIVYGYISRHAGKQRSFRVFQKERNCGGRAALAATYGLPVKCPLHHVDLAAFAFCTYVNDGS